MGKWKHIVVALAMALTAISCVHEFPGEDGGVDPAVIDLELSVRFPEEMNLYTQIGMKTKTEERHVGYVLEIYGEDGKGNFMTGDPLSRIEWTSDNLSNLNQRFRTPLAARRYKIVCWVAYCDASGRGFCYDATDLEDVVMTQHVGNSDWRDAFRGEAIIDLREHTPGKHVSASAEIEMKRPVAKISFLTEDVLRFYEDYVKAMYSNGNKSAAYVAGQQTQAAFGHLKAVFQYDGFMPMEYNGVTDKPIDSKVGASFETPLGDFIQLQERAEIGFDYVFVNGEESSVTMSVLIVDTNTGQTLTSRRGMKVPVRRGRITEVVGKFLTEGSDTGVGIDPAFDGEFNIKI